MGHLLRKDLQVLRRSPLLVALLVLYPLAVAVLVGFAVSGAPDRPRVAFVTEVAEDEELLIGGDAFDFDQAREELEGRVELVDVDTRREAEAMVRDGRVLGALILPGDVVTRLEAGIEAGGLLVPPRVEVLVNEDDPVKARLVDDRISALLAEANLRLSEEFAETTLGYLDLLLRGGRLDVLGRSFNVLGLERARVISEQVAASLPEGSVARASIERVGEFARLAAENLDLADSLIGSVSQPLEVDKRQVAGRAAPLDAFAIAVAAAISLMFVTVLLVAGSIALEREESTYPRLVRGLVSPSSLLIEKIGLGVLLGSAVTMLLLAGLEPFVTLEWDRAGLWAAAIVIAAAGFAALGALIGAGAREVRVSSLLAFMLALPLALLALVPSGTVGPTLLSVIDAVGAAFPFAPALDALQAALAPGDHSLMRPLAHLAGLTALYSLLARLALIRFA